MGRDQRTWFIASDSRHFNPRARVGRDGFDVGTFADMFDFNPRARVGRDSDSFYRRYAIRISIHAPAWGATMVKTFFAILAGISIHAPAWGATTGASRIRPASSNFNPRARVGRDGELATCKI